MVTTQIQTQAVQQHIPKSKTVQMKRFIITPSAMGVKQPSVREGVMMIRDRSHAFIVFWWTGLTRTPTPESKQGQIYILSVQNCNP